MTVTNLDWDAINAKDIFVLFTSFCANNKGHCVEKVEIYPSLFGIEQMKNDIMYGPPKEVFGGADEKRSQTKKKEKRQKNSDGFDLNENYSEDNDF